MKKLLTSIILSLFVFFQPAIAEEENNGLIGGKIAPFEIKHNDGTTYLIERGKDTTRKTNPIYHKTTRGSIMPMNPFGEHHIETIGELELITYLKESITNKNILVIDSRTNKWLKKTGTIPGSHNIPWTLFKKGKNIDDIIANVEEFFGPSYNGSTLDFQTAKTLIFFCNGPWCGQSPSSINAILRLGYPAYKIKYYRGGMQTWDSLGLTTARVR